MNEELWNRVDEFLSNKLGTSDPVLEAALRASAEAGLPAIQVSANQGRLLQLLAQTQGARRILEMGTLGGYSTIWLARALPPEGCLISLELEASYAEVARKNLARANLEKLVTIRVGPAADALAQLFSEKTAPFDFVFIDADKAGYPNYFAWAMKLSRPGTLIVADNVVRKARCWIQIVTTPMSRACAECWTSSRRTDVPARRQFRPWEAKDMTVLFWRG
ncbi:MAG: O-methyltransferase [Chthoniobacterales bacterium]